MVQKQRRRGREVVRPVADADGGADGRQDRDEADVIVRREVLRRDDADAAALFDQVKKFSQLGLVNTTFGSKPAARHAPTASS